MLLITLLLALSPLLGPYLAIVVATTICDPSYNSYSATRDKFLSEDFCGKIELGGSKTKNATYGVPLLSLTFMEGYKKCNPLDCANSFASLLNSCEHNSHPIHGSGSLNPGCGIYNFRTSATNMKGNAIAPISISDSTLRVAAATNMSTGSGAGIRRISGYLLGVLAVVFIGFV